MTNYVLNRNSDNRIGDLFASNNNLDKGSQKNKSSIPSIDVRDKSLEKCLVDLITNETFKSHYYISSLVPLFYKKYSYTFRAVTRTQVSRSKTDEEDTYPDSLAAYLMGIDNKEKHPTRSNLLDSYRDKDCLDLVAIKVEHVSGDDDSVAEPILKRIRLIREFHILGRLYRTKNDHLFPPVGFQMPINFEYVGSTALSSSLGSTVVLSPHGEATIFEKAFMSNDTPEGALIHSCSSFGITDTCYMTMELVGPSISEYKSFFDGASIGRRTTRNVLPVFNVQTILKLMDQVLCRLIVLHRKNIVHLDLRPENVCTGVGRVSNVIYLVNLELAVECSGFPTFRDAGDPAFASVAVEDGCSPNYMMDVESSFYLLLYLLGGRLPWWTRQTGGMSPKEFGEFRARANKEKRRAWRAEGTPQLRQLLQEIQERHGFEYPAISCLVEDIRKHVTAMREEFLPRSFRQMKAAMLQERSRLCEHYHHLRRLLLFPYRKSIVGRSAFFGHRGDIRLQEMERRYIEAEGRGSRTDDGLFFYDSVSWDWGWDTEYKRLDKMRNLTILQKTDELAERIREHKCLLEDIEAIGEVKGQ